jgi:hypothetical protein
MDIRLRRSCCRDFRLPLRLERSSSVGEEGLETQGLCDQAKEGFETKGASAEKIDAWFYDGPDY